MMSRKTSRRELSEFDKGRIVGLADCGKKLAEISKQLEIPRSTVRDFIKRSKERGHYDNVPRPGRPRKTTQDIDKLILEVTDDRLDSLEDIQKQIVPELSVRTIKRRIKEAADKGQYQLPVKQEYMSHPMTPITPVTPMTPMTHTGSILGMNLALSPEIELLNPIPILEDFYIPMNYLDQFHWQNSKQTILLLLLDVRNIWNSQNDFNDAMRLLPVESQLDISRFRFRKDAKMALGSQLLQRYIATMLTGKKWTDIVISKTPQGKSYVANSRFDYNISHHDELVVLAVRPDGKQIGVDITSTVPPTNWPLNWMEGFAQIYSQYEYSQVTSDSTGHGEFFLRWALKESYSKALGMGLNMDLSKLEFRNLETPRLMSEAVEKDRTSSEVVQKAWSNSPQLWINNVNQERWHHELFMLSDNHVIALATHSEDVSPLDQTRLWNITVPEMLSRALPFGPAVAMQPHSDGL